MILKVHRDIVRQLVGFVALLQPLAAWGQSEYQSEPTNYTASSPLDGTNLPYDELYQRLFDAERRLSAIESQRTELLGDQETFVSNVTANNSAYFAEEAKPKKWYEKYSI